MLIFDNETVFIIKSKRSLEERKGYNVKGKTDNRCSALGSGCNLTQQLDRSGLNPEL